MNEINETQIPLTEEQERSLLEMMQTSGLRRVMHWLTFACREAAMIKAEHAKDDAALFHKASERLFTLYEDLEADHREYKESLK